MANSRKYKVHWTDTASRDLDNLLDYIFQNNPVNAASIYHKLKNSAKTLEKQPLRGRIVPELKEHGINIYREIIVHPWRIIYRICNDTVYVISVIDSRRNVEDLLLERFIQAL